MPDNFECAFYAAAGTETTPRAILLIRNSGGSSAVPPSSATPAPQIRVDFSKAGTNLAIDTEQVFCSGFAAESYVGGILTLTQKVSRIWWAEGTVWLINIVGIAAPDLDPGGTVSVTLANVFAAPAAQTVEIPFAIGRTNWLEPAAFAASRTTPATVQINKFQVTPTPPLNDSSPTQVGIQWQTTGAAAVTITGLAGVPPSGSASFSIEQTTAFVLTAYDATFAQIVSQSVTVTINPSLISRLLPPGSIVPYRGSTSPAGWALCDGKTTGVPDLSDRFIVGVGNEVLNASGGMDSHTHSIPSYNYGTLTSSSDPAHMHSLPSAWSAMTLDDGKDTQGINTQGNSLSSTTVQSGGGHSHTVGLQFPGGGLGTNDGGVRPSWYALCYIMRLTQS